MKLKDETRKHRRGEESILRLLKHEMQNDHDKIQMGHQNNIDKCQSSELLGWFFSRSSKKGQALIKVFLYLSDLLSQ